MPHPFVANSAFIEGITEEVVSLGDYGQTSSPGSHSPGQSVSKDSENVSPRYGSDRKSRRSRFSSKKKLTQNPSTSTIEQNLLRFDIQPTESCISPLSMRNHSSRNFTLNLGENLHALDSLTKMNSAGSRSNSRLESHSSDSVSVKSHPNNSTPTGFSEVKKRSFQRNGKQVTAEFADINLPTNRFNFRNALAAGNSPSVSPVSRHRFLSNDSKSRHSIGDFSSPVIDYLPAFVRPDKPTRKTSASVHLGQ